MGALNFYRFAVAAALLLGAAVLSGQAAVIWSLRLHIYVLLFTATMCSMVLGDSAYFVAVRRLGVGRAASIAGSYPLLVAAAAVLFFGEPGSLPLWVGGALTIVGATLLGMPGSAKQVSSKRQAAERWDILGLGLVLCAMLTYAATSLLLKVALTEVDPFGASLVRMMMGTIVLTAGLIAFPSLAGTWPHGRWLLVTLSTGVLAVIMALTVAGGIVLIGAARTTLLTATAPIFAMPFAYLALKERITGRTALGTILVVGGLALVLW